MVQLPVLTAHYMYGESTYKTYLYGNFLNLYGGGQANSIFTTGITVPRRYYSLIWTLPCQSVF
jgi:hypothetical protein